MDLSQQHPRCTICGHPQTGLDRFLGAGICDTCMAADAPGDRLECLRKLGEFEWSSGVNRRRRPDSNKACWVEGTGVLINNADTGLTVAFGRERLTPGDWVGKLFGKEAKVKDLQTGDPEFDPKVLIKTTTEEATTRFLEDKAVRTAIASAVSSRGMVTVDGGRIHVEMLRWFAWRYENALTWERDGLWCVGILFSRFAAFAGIQWPPMSPEDRNPYLIIRATERATYLERYLSDTKELLGGLSTTWEDPFEHKATVQNREVRVVLQTSNAALGLEIECDNKLGGLEFADNRNDDHRWLHHDDRVDCGNKMWAWHRRSTREEVQSRLAKLGPHDVRAILDLMRRNGLWSVTAGRGTLGARLHKTAPDVPPETLVDVITELVGLAALLENL